LHWPSFAGTHIVYVVKNAYTPTAINTTLTLFFSFLPLAANLVVPVYPIRRKCPEKSSAWRDVFKHLAFCRKLSKIAVPLKFKDK